MSDLEEIRRRRMAELQAQQAAAQNQMQQQVAQQAQQQEAQRQFEAEKADFRSNSNFEARARLANLKLTKPQLVEQIEIQLIQSANSGSLRGKVTDEQLKVLLSQISSQKREIKITRK